ncbi:MAG: prolipoprotein diacylglyceryl transferase [Clostridia bacterium]|nr:prolipoprotein diacylglyceryl transferase [Clostridia bacterium]
MHQRLFGVISIYGLLIAAAMAVSVWLCTKREKELGLQKDLTYDLALWVIPAGVAGARLYYVAFRWEMYRANPLSILYVWEGGLAIYGGVIGGALAVLAYSSIKKVPFGKLADMIAPGLLLSQAIGRWGNFFNGEAYGRLIVNPALQWFPIAVFVENEWHMATFFYESAWDLLGFWLLWLNRKKTKAHGDLFLLYLCWYGLGRAVIEGLRTDSLMLGPVRVSQALSAALCVGACIMLCRRRRSEKA